MPVALSYPGVYIEEVASGVRTITGVATSIAAFVGRAARGPTDVPVVINSYAEFEQKFGGLWLDGPMSYAVRDFYMNGGAQAVIARLYSPSFADETARQAALTAATAVAKTAADSVAKAASDAAGVAVPAPTAVSVAKAAEDAVATAGAAAPAALWAATSVAKAASEAAKAPASTPVTVVAATTAAVPTAITDAANRAAPVTNAEVPAKGLELIAAEPGEWGNALRVRVDMDVSQSVADQFGLAKGDLFNLTVRDTLTGVTETFRNVSVKDSSRRVDKVLANESRLIRVKTPPGTMPSGAHAPPDPKKDIWKDDNASSPVTVKASNGNALTQTDFTGTGTEGSKKGLYMLDRTDLFNLLCIPPHALGGDIEGALITDAIVYCEKRRAMMLIDPPSKWTTKEAARDGVDSDVGEASKNAAVFFPRLTKANPLRDGQLEDFVPCGAVAGVFARTDATRGVWKAPAGLDATLKGVNQLAKPPLNDLDNGELNQRGVNCLRTLPAAGRVVWGSRTRVGADRLSSEWKYIPVRRTALFLEESLYRATQWVVFEPNDEPLWSQIRLNVGAFMHGLFRQGAFQGLSPRDAYFVKCDKETTTQTNIDSGIVNIAVGFAPLKPAEFVVIRLQQIAGQIQT